MRLDLVGPRRSAACAALTPRCGIATRLEYDRCPHPRLTICLCKLSQELGGKDGSRGEILPALNRPTMPVRPSQDENADNADQDSGDRDSSDLDSSDEESTMTVRTDSELCIGAKSGC